MMNSSSTGCDCGGKCCPQPEKKKVAIDFLYLDLTVCERCQGAESNLDAALREVAAVLEAAGYAVQVNKINIRSPELAVQYEFLSSPTIRINGQDIAWDVHQTPCRACGDLCGADIDCRSWVYEGNEYAEPPKAMIVSAILKAVFGGAPEAVEPKREYVMPQNLKTFFAGVAQHKDQPES